MNELKEEKSIIGELGAAPQSVALPKISVKVKLVRRDSVEPVVMCLSELAASWRGFLRDYAAAFTLSGASCTAFSSREIASSHDQSTMCEIQVSGCQFAAALVVNPSNSSRQQAGLHMWILCNVNRIIVINEIVANGAAENEQRPEKQCGADRDGATVKIHRERSRRVDRAVEPVRLGPRC